MDKVTKVSISGISFTLEENAYSTLKDYLNRLNSHYETYPNGREIVEGIEERVAELLVDAGGKSGVVSQPMIQKVIDTIGKPEEIYSDGEERRDSTSSSNSQNGSKKRFYRNPNDKVIAGVCGGLGAYFHQDPLWFRITFVMLTLLACFTSNGWWNPFTFFLVYFILCICIPKAVTTAQKCAMRGESLSYDDIEKNAAVHREEHNESVFGNIISLFFKCILGFFGFILLIVGFALIISIIAVVFGISVAGAVIPGAVISAVGMAIGISPSLSILTKILLGLVVILPIIAFIYGGIKLLFKVKTPKWKPGLIMLLVWCLSVIGLIAIGTKISSNFWHQSGWESSEVIVPSSDTLYVQFSGTDDFTDKKMVARGDRDEYSLIYINAEEKDDALLAMYPSIELIHSSDSVCSVNVSSTLFDNTMSYEERKEKEKLNFFSFRNDTLTVDPLYFGKDIPVTEIGRELTITVPENVKVIIPKPIYHQFENEFEHFDTKDFDRKALRKIEKKLKCWKGDINFDGWLTDDENEF